VSESECAHVDFPCGGFVFYFPIDILSELNDDDDDDDDNVWMETTALVHGAHGASIRCLNLGPSNEHCATACDQHIATAA